VYVEAAKQSWRLKLHVGIGG